VSVESAHFNYQGKGIRDWVSLKFIVYRQRSSDNQTIDNLALIVKEEFSQIGNILFSTIVATTVFYEIVGPIFTRYALFASKETK